MDPVDSMRLTVWAAVVCGAGLLPTLQAAEEVKLPEAFPALRAFWDAPSRTSENDWPFAEHREAERNGRQAAEQFYRCRRLVEGWRKHADPVTGLLPRNLREGRDIWNAKDAAADNYPFHVLTAWFTDRAEFEGRMVDMLRTEARVTSRVGRMPDTWSFSKQGFVTPAPVLDDVIFGASEYVKDGLLPIAEWLGPSPWSERMIGIVDDIWKHAPVESPQGKLCSSNIEIVGDNLQALSRLYWFTGDEKYLEWAIRLGDYYLLGTNHPTRDFDTLRLRDHGCEIISGLCELYVTVHFARPKKKEEYSESVHAMCRRVLQIGRNEHGMFYETINPKTGAHSERIGDNWGYNCNGLHAVGSVDGGFRYRNATWRVLLSLNESYRNYPWEGKGGADGFADAIEGALNLYNRERVPGVESWLDSEMRVMWSKQQPDGIVEGWHGDGNVARTALMYALWKTKGCSVEPWREDVIVGGEMAGKGSLCVFLSAEDDWSGTLRFDIPRHREYMRLPLDYPRINQFPEWFTVARHATYEVFRREADGESVEKEVSGEELRKGVPLTLEAGKPLRLIVSPASVAEPETEPDR